MGIDGRSVCGLIDICAGIDGLTYRAERVDGGREQ